MSCPECERSISIAAEKIAEADARSAIAVNCAKAMAMLAQGKVSEDVAVGILNGAEAQMLRACEWLSERDAGMLAEVEKLRKEVVYWKAANDHASKRFEEAANERDAAKLKIIELNNALRSIE